MNVVWKVGTPVELNLMFGTSFLLYPGGELHSLPFHIVFKCSESVSGQYRIFSLSNKVPHQILCGFSHNILKLNICSIVLRPLRNPDCSSAMLKLYSSEQYSVQLCILSCDC